MGIRVSVVLGDLLSDPGWTFEWLVRTLQFNFRDNQAVVLAFEFVDFPVETAVVDCVSCLFDEGSIAQLQECLGVMKRDRVFELDAGGALREPFDGKKPARPCNPDADGPMDITIQVSLTQAHAAS
jgi:hypothetical protein